MINFFEGVCAVVIAGGGVAAPLLPSSVPAPSGADGSGLESPPLHAPPTVRERRDDSDARRATEEPAAYPDTADRTSVEYTPYIQLSIWLSTCNRVFLEDV